jgi:hypothetical protein
MRALCLDGRRTGRPNSMAAGSRGQGGERDAVLVRGQSSSDGTSVKTCSTAAIHDQKNSKSEKLSRIDLKHTIDGILCVRTKLTRRRQPAVGADAPERLGREHLDGGAGLEPLLSLPMQTGSKRAVDLQRETRELACNRGVSANFRLFVDWRKTHRTAASNALVALALSLHNGILTIF